MPCSREGSPEHPKSSFMVCLEMYVSYHVLNCTYKKEFILPHTSCHTLFSFSIIITSILILLVFFLFFWWVPRSLCKIGNKIQSLDSDLSYSLWHTLNLLLILPTPGYFTHYWNGAGSGGPLGPIIKGKITQTMLKKKEVKYNHNYLEYFIFTEPCSGLNKRKVGEECS